MKCNCNRCTICCHYNITEQLESHSLLSTVGSIAQHSHWAVTDTVRLVKAYRAKPQKYGLGLSHLLLLWSHWTEHHTLVVLSHDAHWQTQQRSYPNKHQEEGFLKARQQRNTRNVQGRSTVACRCKGKGTASLLWYVYGRR